MIWDIRYVPHAILLAFLALTPQVALNAWNPTMFSYQTTTFVENHAKLIGFYHPTRALAKNVMTTVWNASGKQTKSVFPVLKGFSFSAKRACALLNVLLDGHSKCSR